MKRRRIEPKDFFSDQDFAIVMETVSPEIKAEIMRLSLSTGVDPYELLEEAIEMYAKHLGITD